MYKVMLTKYSAIYNFLAVSLKRIDFIRNALISIGIVKKEHGRKAFLRPEQIDTAVSVNAVELKWIKDQLPSGTPFGVLLIPARFELMGVEPVYHVARIKFKEELTKLGIDVIDPFQAFFSRGMEKIHFAHDGHWSPLGHEVAGKAAADWLRRELK
ncbi:MAG TPA: hypothetical protein ENI79_00180 [Rhodospirillales bacterium]|nr:hypothetical protein [Rhodospirillales bacterium]